MYGHIMRLSYSKKILAILFNADILCIVYCEIDTYLDMNNIDEMKMQWAIITVGLYVM